MKAEKANISHKRWQKKTASHIPKNGRIHQKWEISCWSLCSAKILFNAKRALQHRVQSAGWRNWTSWGVLNFVWIHVPQRLVLRWKKTYTDYHWGLYCTQKKYHWGLYCATSYHWGLHCKHKLSLGIWPSLGTEFGIWGCALPKNPSCRQPHCRAGPGEIGIRQPEVSQREKRRPRGGVDVRHVGKPAPRCLAKTAGRHKNITIWLSRWDAFFCATDHVSPKNEQFAKELKNVYNP